MILNAKSNHPDMSPITPLRAHPTCRPRRTEAPLVPVPYPSSYLYDYHFECLILFCGSTGTERSGPWQWLWSESCNCRLMFILEKGNAFFSFLVNILFIDSLIYFHPESLRLRFPQGLRYAFVDGEGQVGGYTFKQHTYWWCPGLGLWDPRLLLTDVGPWTETQHKLFPAAVVPAGRPPVCPHEQGRCKFPRPLCQEPTCRQTIL